MPTMISLGSEMLRINPKDNKKLEYSTNKGLTWHPRFGGNSGVGVFSDLMDAGKEILGTTDKGLFYSTNKGLAWHVRKRN